MTPLTIDEIYNQVKMLSLADQKRLFNRLLEDIAPEPPNTFHNEEELEQMLLDGLNSGRGIRLTPEYWQKKKRHLAEQFEFRATIADIHVSLEDFAQGRSLSLEEYRDQAIKRRQARSVSPRDVQD